MNTSRLISALTALSILLTPAVASAQLAPVRATVMATAPNMVEVLVKPAQCAAVQQEPAPAQPEAKPSRNALVVGLAVVGAVVGAVLAKDKDTGTKVGAAILGGAAVGGAAHVVTKSKDESSFSMDAAPASKSSPSQAGAKTSACEPVVSEVQQGYLMLLQVRGKEIVVATEEPLPEKTQLSVFFDADGNMEILGVLK